MKSGTELIAEERARQISVEGWDAEHDRSHTDGALATAAACYALPPERRGMDRRQMPVNTARGLADPDSFVWVEKSVPCDWPFDCEWWKPCPEDRVRELVKAGALVAAEIDRLQRAANVHR